MSTLCSILKDCYTSEANKLSAVCQTLSSVSIQDLCGGDKSDKVDPESEAILNGSDFEGFFPLLVAVALRDVEICHVLLKHGARPQALVPDQTFEEHYCPSALHQACADGSMEIVLLIRTFLEPGVMLSDLFEVENYYGWTPAHFAVQSTNMDIVRLLYREGFDFTKVDHLGNSALHIAVDMAEQHSDERTELVQFLLDQGLSAYDENSDGVTPLDFAIFHGCNDLIPLFVAQRPERVQNRLITMCLQDHVDPKLALSEIFHERDMDVSHFHSMVAIAARHPDSALLRELLDSASRFVVRRDVALLRLDTKFVGHTPLSLAIRAGLKENVRILLEHGADPEATSANGLNPVQSVILNGDGETLIQLLVHGARAQDVQAFSNALFTGTFDMARILLAGGLTMSPYSCRPLDVWIKKFHNCEVDAEFLATLYKSGHLPVVRAYMGRYGAKQTALRPITALLSAVPSLQMWACVAVRSRLEARVFAKVPQLPVPSFLRQKILLDL